MKQVLLYIVFIGAGILETNGSVPSSGTLESMARGPEKRIAVEGRTGMGEKQKETQTSLNETKARKETGGEDHESMLGPRFFERMSRFDAQNANENKHEPSEGIKPILATGSFMIYAVRDPKTFEGYTTETDRYLGIVVYGEEWGELFYNVLGCPKAIDEPRAPAESTDAWQQRYRLKFQQSISEYPMLARIWDTYIDVGYQGEEVQRVRDECLKVRAKTSNHKALAGLGKLIRACNEVSEMGLGLYLTCD